MTELLRSELKEKMAALKSLYASRHYSQCAKFGELLLSEKHDETHPLHLAHLSFYTALAHDTLAREATLKNRWEELRLAESHYNAAILALSPLQSPTQCDPWSPNSSTTSPPSPYPRRRGSIYSNRSAASSVTSLGDEDAYQTSATPSPKRESRHERNDSAVQESTVSQTRAHAMPTSPSRPQSAQQFYVTANISSFVRLIESHVSDVREQRSRTASVPAVHFMVPPSRRSPTKATARQSGPLSDDGEDSAMKAIRESRRNVSFRPRFDPTRTQKLCNEALAELAE
ncbi:uncharacterized protein M421DRAFT_416986 [Didymella exigua CBS 183.55]|uniref:Uncharacterized protein n=1 Tax=Didymella exigua CBS 183.55 TaxID=1150837 RepID=A0A6A5RYH1_9PLEO|nr:uncharacterized protein M421DRAFT_416986 [Didymella exigua CBS 183.55]KAF1932264.1 hypothetical protein M421DRAFT_416986 [Didymella exigua CBS 183.55]